MRKMLSCTYKRWNKMWKLWKCHKLNSPLEELVTYDNYMCEGHYYYFKYLNNDINIRRHMFVLKEFLSKEVYDNLEKAFKLYKENESILRSNKMSSMEIEELFLEVDEFFYDDSYELTKIIMREVSDSPDIEIFNIEKYKIINKIRSSNKS